MRRVFGMVTTRASAEYTRAALRSFLAATPLRADDQVYLIDNDRCVQPANFGAAYPRLNLIVNSQPLSFAENGNNIIKLAAGAEADAYYMNNDIIFTPGWSEPLSADLDGLITPTCNQNFQYETPNFALRTEMCLEDYEGHEQDLLQMVQSHQQSHQHYTRAYKTPFFCVKFPRKVYQTVGFLDTRFGMAGGEDDDYCLRTHLAGLSVIVAEASYLLHFHGRSTWAGPETREDWQRREQKFITLFQQKWGPTATRFLIFKDRAAVDAAPDLQHAERSGGMSSLMRRMVERDKV